LADCLDQYWVDAIAFREAQSVPEQIHMQERFLQYHQNEVKLALYLGFYTVTALRKLVIHHTVVRHLFLFRQPGTFVPNHLINDVPNIKNASEKWPIPGRKTPRMDDHVPSMRAHQLAHLPLSLKDDLLHASSLSKEEY